VTISPYVAKLREKIGTDLLLLPAVSVLPTDAHGRVLLVRQKQHGKWETVGGTIEPGESPEEAALRETKEETDLDVAVSLIAALGGPDCQVTYNNGDRVHYVSIVYEGRVLHGEARPDDDEIEEVGWFTTDELQKLDLGPLAVAQLTTLGYLS
jgi:ADP-ribose pyrophosphatase YjhB (NUDIX family)